MWQKFCAQTGLHHDVDANPDTYFCNFTVKMCLCCYATAKDGTYWIQDFAKIEIFMKFYGCYSPAHYELSLTYGFFISDAEQRAAAEASKVDVKESSSDPLLSKSPSSTEMWTPLVTISTYTLSNINLKSQSNTSLKSVGYPEYATHLPFLIGFILSACARLRLTCCLRLTT